MRVAGFDPSLRNFAMVKGDIKNESLTLAEFSLVETLADNKNKKHVRKNSDDLNRAKSIATKMHAFIEDVDLIFVEIPVGSQTARAMTSYGICVGLLASINVPMIQVTPSEVKVAATGSKTATKAQMIDWAVESFPGAPWLRYKRKGEMILNDKNEHLADATAAIFAGVRTDTYQQLMALQR